MRHAIRIGRVFGIELLIDTSWLVIFVLVTWSLTSLFTAWHPVWPAWTSFGVAAVAALLFFGSVLLHELAHSLVARAYGLPVRDITLHMFGGVSSIEREPERPGAELLIALVGPITSIGLGILMLVATSAITGIAVEEGDVTADPAAIMAGMGPVATLLAWLGPVNVIVGLFNLIPGFPLDGGRILRSIVWKATGDVGKATRISATVGQIVGWCFVATGFLMALGFSVPFFGRGLLGGIWLALIGMFLRNAAVGYYVSASMKEALVGVRVESLMRTRGPWVGADVTLRALVDHWFIRSQDDGFPVFDEGRFVGFVTADDVRGAGRRADVDLLTVRDVMAPPAGVATIAPEQPVADVMPKFASSERRQLMVVSRGTLVGILDERDVLRWIDLAPHRAVRPGLAPRATADAGG
jgi:Zn-dependent protease